MLDSCCTNSSANGMHPESDADSETLIALTLLMTETKQLTSAAMNGFKEEKRYARSTINALDNTICKALEEVDDTVTHVKATVSQERKETLDVIKSVSDVWIDGMATISRRLDTQEQSLKQMVNGLAKISSWMEGQLMEDENDFLPRKFLYYNIDRLH